MPRQKTISNRACQMTDTVLIRDAAEADLPAIRDIYNHAVEHTTAIWNETLVDLDNRLEWFKARKGRGFPVIVAEMDGKVAGYASYGDWRAFDGYRHTVEHSVYVDKDCRGAGIGEKLMRALIERASAGNIRHDRRHRGRKYRLHQIAREAWLSHRRHIFRSWHQIRPLAGSHLHGIAHTESLTGPSPD
jgi:phosphinothricin acetyltransferase